MKIINPFNEEVIKTLESESYDSTLKKIEKLRRGQPLWAQRLLEDRLSIIVRFGDLVKQKTDELAAILTSETGKPIQQAVNEIRGAHNRIEHLKANASKWLQAEVMVEKGPTREEIQYEPLGVIGNISAWNFPYNVGYNVFLYGLVAGNSVAYKPSEYAALTGLKFRELLWEAGVPEDVFECFIGPGEVGEWLLEAGLDGYFFTGSYKTGKYIAEKLAPKLVPLQLELGGKDPLYVMDDLFDIKQAAINAAEGAFYNNGQSCCAVERIYVHEKIYEEFVTHFVEEVSSYKIGNPMDRDTFIGPLTRKDQLEKILQQIGDAVKKGASIRLGGKKWGRSGYFLEPTVLIGVNHTMDVMMDESFGPVIGIQPVKGDDEAAELMKDTKYGLTAAVFSNEEKRARELLSRLPVGTAYWNCCDRVSPNLPWTGRKNSGLGITLSYMGIRAFVQPKAFHIRY